MPNACFDMPIKEAPVQAFTAWATRLWARVYEQKLVLIPKETPDGQVLEVSGDVDLFGGDDRVVLMVSRDGFGQHYRPFGIPAAGILLNPTSELNASA